MIAMSMQLACSTSTNGKFIVVHSLIAKVENSE